MPVPSHMGKAAAADDILQFVITFLQIRASHESRRSEPSKKTELNTAVLLQTENTAVPVSIPVLILSMKEQFILP